MSDLIRIIDLEVWSRIGVPEEERAHPQRLLINLELRGGDFKEAAANDDIALTIDYAEVATYVKNFANERPRKLLETFAEDLSAALLSAFHLKRLRLEIKKFVVPNTAFVAVEIEHKAKKPKKNQI